MLLMLPTMVGILVVSFLVIKLAPGDPSSQKFGGLGQATGGMAADRGVEQAIKKFREKYHLDDSLPVQFGFFLKRLFTGEMIFFQDERPIWGDLFKSLWITVQINFVVFLLIYLIAIPSGIYSAAKQGSWGDRISTVALFVLYSIPSFWAAEMLRLRLTGPETPAWIRFPVANLHQDDWEELSYWGQVADWWHHATLPIICLTYVALAYLSRQMRVGLLDVIRQDYIRTAKAKGASEIRVLLVHALRNGLFPVITLFASLLPFLVGGSVIIEFIFEIRGMGRFAIENVYRREYDAVMATLMLSAVLTLVGILISDILYVLVNPQVSFESRRK
ncbi:Dipeptide transport system permease protein DppB [Stratiformator vulcanicus]|uniref:Dipeptide transport system permease protein DppB n=2 Tax=Stratiformator vulcanicus TaxID=2527980 RepID=A0A517R0D4_9PLAN|nr:Dipeptide transport system permease protein DppB [Stratiformator vulcanicus]